MSNLEHTSVRKGRIEVNTQKLKRSMNFRLRYALPRPLWGRACFALLLTATLALPSCKKEYFELDRVKDATWNPELAVPLIKSTVTVPEVLDRFDDQDIITVDPSTGLLALRYFSTVFSIQADQWLHLPSAAFTQGVPITPQQIADITANGSSTMTGSVAVPFNGPNGEGISRARFKAGNIDFNFNSGVGYPAVVTLSIPDLVVNGTQWTSGAVNIPANGSATVNIPLPGAVLDQTTNGNANEFEVNFTLTYNSPGSAVPGSMMTVDMDLTGPSAQGGPTFAEIAGDFGQQSIPVPLDSVGLRIFDNDAGGVIIWDSALVRGFLSNTYGLSIRADLPVFRVHNTETGQTVDVTFPAGMFPMTIPSATPGTYAPGRNDFELVANNNGANVNTVMNLNPNRLIYQADLTSNPAGGISNNFMRDTSKMQLDIEAILPFDGRAVDFKRVDTAEVDIFPINDDIEEIVSITLRLTIDNGFPADAHAQVSLYDTSGTVLLKKLFPDPNQQVFGAATPNAQGYVDQSQKVRTTTDITLDRATLEDLEARGFGKVILEGWIETFNEGQTRVKIFNTYSMDLWLGMMVEAKVNVDL